MFTHRIRITLVSLAVAAAAVLGSGAASGLAASVSQHHSVIQADLIWNIARR
jgi:hypothetical protein